MNILKRVCELRKQIENDPLIIKDVKEVKE